MARAITTPEFEKAFKMLNKEQKKAVETIEGPVMVIAGPGTGKTQILTLRIANILRKTDTAPDSILALTFTESAAHTMRRRLSEIIGSPAYKVNIYTFHGFCNSVIQTYPEEFPRIIGATNITDVDQVRIMEEVLDSLDLEKLKPYGDPYYYLRPALSQIQELKRDDIDPQVFKKLIKHQEQDFKNIEDLYYDKGVYKGKMKGEYKDLEKNIEKNKDLLKIYEAYEKALEKERLYDYDDMLMEVIQALKKNHDLLLRLQERFQYILADEHQDANQAQNHILELLASFYDSPNLFIVGDEKQAIFRFQGASLENFLYFKRKFKKAVVVTLVENYRSTQSILDAAHSLIEKNPVQSELRQKLKSQNTSSKIPEEKIKIYAFSEAESEQLYLVQDIEKKIKNGVKPQEIAVLFRDNKDVVPIIRVFEKTSIPFVVESGQNVLADEDIAKLVLLLRAVNDLGDTSLMAELLFIDFLNIETLDGFKIIRYARDHKISINDILENSKILKQAKISHLEKLKELHKKLSAWAKQAKNENIIEFFERIVRESEYLEFLISRPGALDKLHKLDTLFTEIQKVAERDVNFKLSNLIRHLEVIESHTILIKSEMTGPARGVRLMTAHRSKGLEFEYVYIVGAYDGHWGNKRDMRHFRLPQTPMPSSDPLDDERRLFYVALTRARKAVAISFARKGYDKKEQLPTQFIEEINPKIIEKVETAEQEKDLVARAAFTYSPRTQRGVDIKSKDYIQNLFLEQGLSVTALNKYLKCPWDYFFENLISIPKAKSKHQLYGTAIHETLKVFFDAYKNKKNVSKKDLLKLFEKFLTQKQLSHQDFKASREKGIQALSGYYDTYKNTWSQNSETEFRISGIPLPFKPQAYPKQTVLLRGSIDKIEFGKGDEVIVTDYKSRQPLSRNEIEGKTKNSRGDYKRQLVFYKLLLDRFEMGRYRMKSGIIDFIEPDAGGKYKREQFEITALEIKELEKLIQKVAEEIYTLAFWDRECDEKDCEYCRLRKFISPRRLK